MDLEQQVTLLGKLSGNIRSLEFLLRAALLDNGNDSSTNWRTLDSLKVGDTVPNDALTNYDSLGGLIKKYNSQIAQNNSEKIDVGGEILRIRDALAHGRNFANSPEPSALRIIKFSKPKDGKVTVEFSEILNKEWLKLKINTVKEELKKVNTQINR